MSLAVPVVRVCSLVNSMAAFAVLCLMCQACDRDWKSGTQIVAKTTAHGLNPALTRGVIDWSLLPSDSGLAGASLTLPPPHDGTGRKVRFQYVTCTVCTVRRRTVSSRPRLQEGVWVCIRCSTRYGRGTHIGSRPAVELTAHSTPPVAPRHWEALHSNSADSPAQTGITPDARHNGRRAVCALYVQMRTSPLPF